MSTTPQGISQAQAVGRAEEAAAVRVLLAEDDRSLRRYLEVVLRRAGYEVAAAADGLEAMKALLSSEFDAVVTDAVMPHLTGYELCRFVRRHPKLKGLPVVLLTGEDRAQEPPDADARPDAYLSKPVPPEQLAACVERLVEAKA